ncbi:MAG: HD domain-containing protein [Acidobacteria bacterium]|nr:HD domain-containing protein [Acidobacteriota bacterium]
MLGERFEEAMVFAHRLHRKQKRKTSGVPYVGHLLGVAALVIEDGGGEDEAIAALLHDSLEDQGRHYEGGAAALAEEIERRFGGEVRRLVEALTERAEPDVRAIADKRERWRAHKRAYFAAIAAAGVEVRRISCADSLYNVRSLAMGFRAMGPRIWQRFLTGRAEDQVWAYRGAAEAFRAAGTGPMAEELAAAVDLLEGLAVGAGEG